MTLGFSANLAVAKLDVLESNPTHQSLLKTEKSLKKTTESTLPMKHTLTEPIFVVKGEHEGIILRYTNETYDSGKVKKTENKYLQVTANTNLGGPELYQFLTIPGRNMSKFDPSDRTHDPLFPISLTNKSNIIYDGSTESALFYIKCKIPTTGTKINLIVKIIQTSGNKLLEQITIPFQLVVIPGTTSTIPETTTSITTVAKLRPANEPEEEDIQDTEMLPVIDEIVTASPVNSPAKLDEEINRTKALVNVLKDWRINEIENFTFWIDRGRDQSNDPQIKTKIKNLTSYILTPGQE